jgi:hypothetical protein
LLKYPDVSISTDAATGKKTISVNTGSMPPNDAIKAIDKIKTDSKAVMGTEDSMAAVFRCNIR